MIKKKERHIYQNYSDVDKYYCSKGQIIPIIQFVQIIVCKFDYLPCIVISRP
jgi:hypothetical protein